MMNNLEDGVYYAEIQFMFKKSNNDKIQKNLPPIRQPISIKNGEIAFQDYLMISEHRKVFTESQKGFLTGVKLKKIITFLGKANYNDESDKRWCFKYSGKYQ